MTIPPFVKLEHDAAARKAYVTVEDREVKKQREMWGMSSTMTSWFPY
jgi:large subunit ribosomal protein L6